MQFLCELLNETMFVRLQSFSRKKNPSSHHNHQLQLTRRTFALHSTSKSQTVYQKRMFQLQFSSIYFSLRSAPIHNQRNSSYRFRVALSLSPSLTHSSYKSRVSKHYHYWIVQVSWALSLCYQFSSGKISFHLEANQNRIRSSSSSRIVFN